MKKLKIFAIVCAVALFSVACDKEEEQGNTDNNISIEGRWEAPRFADNPEDIAFVAIFGSENLDLYIIPWGHHLVGSYALSNGKIQYDITAGYQAFTGVTYDSDSNMVSWSWMAGNLDAATLTLTEGYDWYPMGEETLNQAKEDFGEIEFRVNGNTATSTLVGIPDVTFHKVQ
jgi:hypothetical protein